MRAGADVEHYWRAADAFNPWGPGQALIHSAYVGSYTVVRFEDGWAVLSDEHARTFSVPRDWLPPSAAEGDRFEMSWQPSIDAGTAPNTSRLSGPRVLVYGAAAVLLAVLLWAALQ